MHPTIDYLMIGEAVDHFTTFGYKYIHAPWFVSKDSLNVTKPPEARYFETFAGHLVASGEQSFIEIRDQLKPGRYQCVTPCFRDEPIHDELHLQYFIKNELIIVVRKGIADPTRLINEMIRDVLGFIASVSSDVYAKIIDTELGKDITLGEIEIGSYGYREYGDFAWIYGTGCAEPRFSQAIKKLPDLECEDEDE